MRNKKIFKRKFYELTGSVHIHTEYSHDSTTSLKKILGYAHKYGIDFITVNDHFTKEAENDPVLKKEKKVKCLVGIEVNDKDLINHYLVFGSDDTKKRDTADEYVRFYKEEGAVGFIAHPIDERKNYSIKDYPWTATHLTEFDGIEIWNYVSSWLRNLNPKKNGLFWVLFQNLIIKRPPRKNIEFWDNYINRGFKKAAIGSIDAHTHTLKILGKKISILTHKSLMKSIRTNVLIPRENGVTNNSILQAMKKGNSYIINYKLGRPYDFYAGVTDSKNVKAIFGEEIEFNKDLKFYYKLPSICNVFLYRNGKLYKKDKEEKGYFNLDKPGAYRLEIEKYHFGWIYTNNIYIK